MTYPTTANLGLPLVPDGDTAWGQAMRDAMVAIDGLAVMRPARVVASVTTTLLAPGGGVNVDITLAKSCKIQVVGADFPAEIRLYNTSTARIADAGRATLSVPAPGMGLVSQNTFPRPSDGAMSIGQDPEPNFSNKDEPAVTTGYLALWNRDTVSRTITVSITHLPQE